MRALVATILEATRELLEAPLRERGIEPVHCYSPEQLEQALRDAEQAEAPCLAVISSRLLLDGNAPGHRATLERHPDLPVVALDTQMRPPGFWHGQLGLRAFAVADPHEREEFDEALDYLVVASALAPEAALETAVTRQLPPVGPLAAS